MVNKMRAFGLLCSLLSTSGFCSSFYLGAGLGPESVDFSQKTVYMQGPSLFSVNRAHFSGTGMFGTLFGGYQYNNKRFYLAGEVNANLSSAESKITSRVISTPSESTTTRYKMNQSYGVSVLPGFLLSDMTLFYGRLGYANGNFKLSTSDTGLKNVNTNLSGVRFGAGIKQAVSKNLAVRLEYSQINYEAASIQVLDNALIKNSAFTPESALVEFGLVYNFV